MDDMDVWRAPRLLLCKLAINEWHEKACVTSTLGGRWNACSRLVAGVGLLACLFAPTATRGKGVSGSLQQQKQRRRARNGLSWLTPLSPKPY
jgi:hypothetical protein